ncbi:MAG: ureidoglycolate hydrolase [Acidobacteria bacterium]|nr:ureidoglycolate hydrolase [Acidobacteriota bacterium]
MLLDYLNPEIPPHLPVVESPFVIATPESVKGYGELVTDPQSHPVKIVRWPAAGWREVDEDTGDEAGTTDGVFACGWDGERLMARNDAVGGHYVLGFSRPPGETGAALPLPPQRLLLWHANYHPDGGQLFYPQAPEPFVVPLALPGDDVRPEYFKTFWFDGSCGLYIHPNIWHEGVFPCGLAGRYFDRQGRVHARVSCHFPREFGVLLSVPLGPPAT